MSIYDPRAKLAAVRGMSDVELNETIDRILGGDPMITTTVEEEAMAFLASAEWARRHPSTIPPATFMKAVEKGGFPSCYSGPRATIDLTTGKVVYAAAFGPHALIELN